MKKLLSALALLVCLYPSVVLASLPIMENFTAADGTNLNTYNANWAATAGSLQIQSNSVQGNSSAATSWSPWTADTPGNDQYAEMTIAALNVGSYIGVMTRVTGAGRDSFYTCFTNGTTTFFREYASGGIDHTTTSVTVPTVGQKIRIESSGTTQRCLVNGSQVLSETDTTLTGGLVGIFNFNNGATRADDFLADTISSNTYVSNPTVIVVGP